jgi:hypothetical protein
MMRLELSVGPAKQSWFPGDREARSVCHIHDGLTSDSGPVLLIGRDDGRLEIVPDHHTEWTRVMPVQRSATSTGRIHLDTWWSRRTDLPTLTIDDTVECAPDATAQYAMGVTAIAALPRPGASDTIDILVATRHPWLYVIESRAGVLRLTRRMSVPGWIDQILAPRFPGEPITCLSRGGYLIRFTREALLSGDSPNLIALPFLPTTALWLDPRRAPADLAPVRGENHTERNHGGLLIGTTTGLFLVRDAPGGQLAIQAVPVTRAGVLSLASTMVDDREGAHDYVALGLGDGRLRVATAETIRERATGASDRSATMSFSVELGAAVLAMQALQPQACPPDQAYLLTVLRDHSMRLFRIVSERTQRDRVMRQWKQYVARIASRATGTSGVALELDAASSGPPPGIEPIDWIYMLIDSVLPALCAQIAELPESNRTIMYGRVADLITALAAGADPIALQQLSSALHALTGGDILRAQRLSAAIVAAAVARSGAGAIAFVDSHLRALSALAVTCTDNERPILVFWMRFLRKYVVRGPVFTAKRLRVLELVEQNYRARKYLDALIYQARLHRQGYDLLWQTPLGDKVAAVHFARFAQFAERAVVIVVMVSGRIAVLDRTTGDRLAITETGEQRDALAPFEPRGKVRTLASAVVEDLNVVRVVLSGEGERLRSPGVAVIDLSVDPYDPSGLIARVAYPSCEAHTRVYAVAPLPGRTDAFVVGLDVSDHPIGRLSLGSTWVLERATRTRSGDRPEDEGPQLAPGKVPTRGVSVVEAGAGGKQFLVAAGSDDGRVFAFTFAAGDRAGDWRLKEWNRVTDPIRCVVLGRHDAPSAAASQTSSAQSLFSCYLGTTAGDTLALSIIAAPASGSADHPLFGPYDAQALWRETHDAPVLVAQLWRTSLFRVHDEFPDQVLVLVTENGRMCIYHHSGVRSHRVSAQNNYYFRGLRLDRIALPDRVSGFALAENTGEFAFASSDGQVCLARLAYARGSVERSDPETRSARHPKGSDAVPCASVPPELPTESWARLHHLFTASQIDEPFELPPDQRAPRKLDLCELIRLDDGVLSAYALRERLVYHEPWDQLDASEIRIRASALLQALDPDHREHAERIKVIIKSLCGAFLSRHPDQLRAEILARPQLPRARAAAIAAVCDLVHEYILDHLTRATRGGARLAIVAMKELLRVPMLYAMASGEDHGDAVRMSMATALAACLRHDDRLVRTETLRAASVMLRNVGVMVLAHPEVGDRLLSALVPHGLASLTWLLDPIIDGLLRSPGFNTRTVLVSGAWYRVSVIAQLFWIFPDHTLTLCDHLLSRGIPVDVLGLCVQTMRGDRVQETKHRIEHWFLIPDVGRERARDHFIAHYRVRRVIPTQPSSAPNSRWHEVDDVTMARRLAELFDQLAQMWAIEEPEQLRVLSDRLPRRVHPPVSRASPPDLGDSPLAMLERVVAQLLAVASALTEGHPRNSALLSELRRSDGPARSRVPRPIQTIATAIADHWIGLCEPRAPASGDRIGRFVLGDCIGEGSFGKVFEIDAPPEYRGTHVVKVFKRFTQDAREQFLQGARFTQKISSRSSSHSHVAQILEIVEPASSRPAYLMRQYDHDLRYYFDPGRLQQTRKWAADAARHIAEALRDVHANARSHGDVKASNVLVDRDRQTMQAQFFLADFDLVQTPGDSIDASPSAVPLWLSQKCQSDDSQRVRQWLDLASLCCIAYQMLTGEELGSLALCTDRLARLPLSTSDQLGPRGARLITTLRRVFELPESIGIEQFLRWLEAGPPRRSQRAHPTRLLFLAANPASLPDLQQLEVEYNAVNAHVAGRSEVELWAVKNSRIRDMVAQAGQSSPHILHFSGHGSPDGVFFSDDTGRHQLVTGDALARFLDGRRVALVVLNSCYSSHQCDAILPVVGAVVGTTDRVNDEAARQFSDMFYQQVLAGKKIGEAFKDARDNLGLNGYSDQFHARGKLHQVLVPRRRHRKK